MQKIISLYGIFGFLKLFFDLLRTKIFYPKARIIRFPFSIRNRRYINLGNRLTTGVGCRIEAHPPDNYKDLCIIFGENVEINDYVHIAAHKRIEIGNNVLIAGKIFITDLNHGSYGKNDIHDSPEILPNDRQLSAEPVIIEDNVWIGEFVSILPGVRIGKGSIIGTMSVVSKSIPEYCIAAGSPAKIIKRYDFNLGKWIRE